MKIKTSRPIIERKSNAHGGGHGGGGHHGGGHGHGHGRSFRESDLSWNGVYWVSGSGACFTKNVHGDFISVACGVPSVVMGI